jgi:cobalt-zinc-cadmium efflux system protein
MSRWRRLELALGLNFALVVAQTIGGLAAHSMGLLSDAGHNLADVAAILVSVVAVRLARRAPTTSRSYGYHRATILAAAANAAAILAVTIVIVFEAIRRLQHPQAVRGGLVVIIAVGALIINAGAAVALDDHSADLNMRSAWLHMAGDAFASLGVAVAGALILVTGRFSWADPVVSIAIALLIAVEGWRLLRGALDVLLESTPADVDLDTVVDTIAHMPGVEAVHDLHVWSLSSEVRALSAHLVLSGHPTLEEAQVVGEAVKASIVGSFAIAHTTLELECEACVDADEDPCGIDLALTTHKGHRH